MMHKIYYKEKGEIYYLGESNNELQDYIKNINENSFFLKETEPGEV